MAVSNEFTGLLTTESTLFTTAAIFLAKLFICTALFQMYGSTLASSWQKLELGLSGLCALAAFLFLIFLPLRNGWCILYIQALELRRSEGHWQYATYTCMIFVNVGMRALYEARGTLP
jgi:hypothetical protein